jgi:hypothetical protein
MKKIVSILSAVVFLAATGVFIFGQNAFAEEPGILMASPESGDKISQGDIVNIEGEVTGSDANFDKLIAENRLFVRVGRKKITLTEINPQPASTGGMVGFSGGFGTTVASSNTNDPIKFTGSFKIPTRFRGRRIVILARVKIDDNYYFDKVKLRVNRSNGHGHGHYGHGYGHHGRWYGKKDSD